MIDATFIFKNFTHQPLINRAVTLTPSTVPDVYGVSIVVGDSVVKHTDVTGSVLFSVIPQTYKVRVH